MPQRIHGLETELMAVAIKPDGTQNTDANPTIEEFLFRLRKIYGNFTKRDKSTNIEITSRAILPNQGQAYVDQGDYFEICTPECTSILDLVLHEKISRAIVRKHLQEFNKDLNINPDPAKKLYLFSSAADALTYSRGSLTNGCHENFLCYGTDIIEKILYALPTFLIARTLLEGTGLFYCLDNRPTDDKKISFCISQRIEFIEALFSADTTHHRPLISNKTETLAGEIALSGARLHIIKGEHNQTPFGNFIKMGTVSLLIDMVEAGYFREKCVPRFHCIPGNLIPEPLRRWLNHDLAGRYTYDFTEFNRKMRLCDILDMYAEWMLDFLEKGDCGNSDSACCDHLLYLEKLEAAQQLKRAADCFARQDIFALVGDVEWITKLWWFQDWLETEYGIVIDDDDLSVWAHLETFLPLARRDQGARNEIINKILWKDLFWHSLDRQESDYGILEESGLINPLVIDGKIIDPSIDGRFNEAPQNPPNRSSARKKLWDIMHKLGLKNFLLTGWTDCRIIDADSPDAYNFGVSLKFKPRSIDVDKKFPWGEKFVFDRPLKTQYESVNAFIKKIRELFEITDE